MDYRFDFYINLTLIGGNNDLEIIYDSDFIINTLLI